jgi:hypothetical protein
MQSGNVVESKNSIGFQVEIPSVFMTYEIPVPNLIGIILLTVSTSLSLYLNVN